MVIKVDYLNIELIFEFTTYFHLRIKNGCCHGFPNRTTEIVDLAKLLSA